MEPHGATAQENLGSLAVAQERLGDAITHYRAALEREPDRVDLQFRLAQILRWVGHLSESVDRLRALHARQPQDDEIRKELARALLSHWEFEDAARLWSRILADEPDNREARLADAMAALHTGRARAAILAARRLINEEPTAVEPWRILADAAQYDGRMEEAWLALDSWFHLARAPEDRDYLHARRIALRIRMHERDPARYPLSEVLELARAYAAEFHANLYARLTLAETLARAGRYLEARELFLRIIREDNRQNIRALRGLFELALALRDLDEAGIWLDHVEAFNPADPYLAAQRARLYAARGDIRAANAALDRLAAAGERGAAAVLLHHALTPSPYGPALQTARFRDHLRALLAAGYRVLTPDELHAHWDAAGPAPGLCPAGRVRREVMITFDDAMESAMRFGTRIAEQYGVRFAQHIIAGFVDRGDPYLSTWDELRAYRDTGAWVFGSHLYRSHVSVPVGRDERRGYPMGTRIWLPDEDRLETEAEFFARLRTEYRRSQQRIREELDTPASFVAYPYGDIGQELVSDMPEAVPINMNHARDFYEIGFIQNPMAHAVRGDNPLLYQRHEMPILADGEETVRYLLDRHPIFHAERTRFDLALAEGRAARARAALNRLEQRGYPSPAIRDMEPRMRRDMARAFAVPDLAPRRDRLDPRQINAQAGLEADLFRNRFDAQHVRARLNAGLVYSPHVLVQTHAGAGRYRQAPQDGERRAVVDDRRAGLGLTWVRHDRTVLEAGGGWRELEGSTRSGIALAWVEAHGRVAPALDLRVRFERDAMDDAVLLARGVSRSLYVGQAAWEPAEGWRLDTSMQHEAIGDGNRRTSVRAAPVFTGVENDGWRFGGVYAFTAADREVPNYWTPESMHSAQVLIAHQWRGAFGTVDLSTQFGWGRERNHPEERDPEDNPVDDPSTRWRPALGIQGWWSLPFDHRFSGRADAGFHRNPGYDEFRARLHFQTRF